MTTIQGTKTLPLAHAAALWQVAACKVGALLRFVVEEIRARRTVRELNDLSDHMLADIGLSRDQLQGNRLERRL